jgi:FkbM family methyltransferase
MALVTRSLSLKLRPMAEAFSRGVVLRRKLPAQFGSMPIYVTPEAGLRFWGPSRKFDPFLYRMVAELVKPGSVVWDIGANVGLFAFSSANIAGSAGKVLAVEPDPWLCTLLNRSVASISLPIAPVEVLSAAISDRIGIANLLISSRSRASNHLVSATGSGKSEGSRAYLPAMTLTLDWLLAHFPAPSVLKIDVETHEARVLAGASRLLKEVRPVVWCEVDHQNSAEVTDIFTSAGYTLKSAHDGKAIPKAWWNTLAIPL